VHQALFVLALQDEAVRARLAAEFARWRAPFVVLFEQIAAERGLDGYDAMRVGETFAVAADALVQQQVLDPSVPTATMLRATSEQLIASGNGIAAKRSATRAKRQPASKKRR
jgi:hypothetical protein